MNSLLNTSINIESAKWLLLLSSFLGGVIASISPCSLSMLPVIVGYVGGYSNNSVSKTVVQLFAFILGTAIVFTIIGIICAVTGNVFVSIGGNYFMLIIASILMIMGLNLIGVLDIHLPALINKVPKSDSTNIILYPILLGATFALAGSPCSTPILAGIMSIASVAQNILLAVCMLFLFSLGQGLILLIAGLFTSFVKNFGKIAAFSEILLKISGAILILASLIFYYKIFNQFWS